MACFYKNKQKNIFYIQQVVQGSSTVCPRSSDPFFIVTYNIKWLLLGHGHIVGLAHVVQTSNKYKIHNI